MTYSKRTAGVLSLLFAAIVVAVGLVMMTRPTEHACGDATCEVGDDEVFASNIAWDSDTAYTVTLDHAATADVTVTIPTQSSSTLVAIDATQTLTNKTLTAPSINTGLTVDADLAFTGPQAITTSTGDLTLNPAGDLVIPTGTNLDVDGVVSFGDRVSPVAGTTLQIDHNITATDYTYQLDVEGYATVTDNTYSQYAAFIHPAGIIVNSSNTHPVVASLAVMEPRITEQSGSVVQTGVSLYIYDAPDEGNANYALFVDSGESRFDDKVTIDNNLEFVGTRSITTTAGNLVLNPTDHVDLNSNDVLSVGNANTHITSTSTTFGVDIDFGGNDLSNIGNANEFNNLVVVAASNASSKWLNNADYLCDGTADEVQIQAALDALPAAGGVVQLSQGIFKVAAPIVFKQHRQTLQGVGFGFWEDYTGGDPGTGGEGAGVTKLEAQADNFNVLEFVDIDNVALNYRLGGITIRDIYIYGGGKTGGQWGIYTQDRAQHHDQCIIERVFIHNTQGGMQLAMDASRVIDNTVMDTGSYDAIGISGVYFQVRGNVIADTSGDGIVVEPAGASVRGWLVADNVIVRVDKGITIEGTDGRGGVANNNISYSNDISIYFLGALQVIVEGNVIISDLANVIALHLDTISGDNILTGNLFIQEDRNNAQEAILIHADADNNIVMNNIITTEPGGGFTWQTPAIGDDGSGNFVRHNKGYVTENSSTSTVANGQTNIVVTHGMAATPTAGEIQVTPTNSMGNATKFYVDTITATQFTIHVDADPGATTATFAWQIRED